MMSRAEQESQEIDAATVKREKGKLEARAGIEPAMEVLQTSALPLGYRAKTTCQLPIASFLQPAPDRSDI